jgi:hypothetical protein
MWSMSNAERQARWRASTSRKRVELYLSPEVLEWIDATAQECELGRAAVVECIFEGIILPPLLVDIRRHLLDAYRVLLQAATRQPLRPIAVHSILDKAIRELEKCDT